MKHNPKLLLAVIAALAMPGFAKAVTLNEAKITQIVKDVKKVDPANGAKPASLNEKLQGEQAVRTGIESRTELLFNDQTITRLGANTHFSFSEGTRNMSLNSGVMLLQVPKGIGGAKIQTAAVTAALTGTTVMLEAGKDYTKLIVLEGECCLWPKAQKKGELKMFKFRHKVCATAGQEIILRNGDTEIPEPFYVNLTVLENTSKLLNGKWGAQINYTPVDGAKDDQNPKDYIPTNLAIIGAGTDVVVIQGERPPGTGDNNPQPTSGAQPPVNPPTIPGKYGPLVTITSPNPYVINGGSSINTDPTVTTNGVVDYGKIYRGQILDGHAAPYLFGPGSGVNQSVLDYAFARGSELFPNYGVAAYRFSNLVLQGAPSFEIAHNGADDVALISESNITLSAASPTVFDFAPLHGLLLATAKGSITIGSNVTLQGLGGFLNLFNNGAANGITINGNVDLPAANFFATTQGTFGGSGAISARTISVGAGGLLTLNETGGEPVVDLLNNVEIDTGVLQSLTLSGNGISVPNGFYAPSAYLNLTATAGNALPGDITLAGGIYVNNIFASAANNLNVLSGAYISTYAFNASAGNNATLAGTSKIYADTVRIDANTLQLNGSISNGEGSASSFKSNTYGGDSDNTDFSGNGSIDAQTIEINSNGDLNLATAAPSPSATPVPKVNGVAVNPNDNLQELDLTGRTVQVGPFSQSAVVLKTTANSGDITINGDISVKEFSASTYGAVINNSQVPYTVTAGTVSLSVPNVNGTLSYGIDANTFTFYEDTTGGSPISSIPLVLTGTSPVLSITANALTVTNPEIARAFVQSQLISSGLTLNLTSYNDINGDLGDGATSATIDGAKSVSLQVGVSAILTGDSESYIHYDNSALTNQSHQLYIDTTNLSSFSFAAGTSITVGSGFPSLDGSLTLSADAITGNSTLDVGGNINLTAYNGDIAIYSNVTTGGSFTAYASGNIGFNFDPVIGTGLSLTAGNKITFDNSFSINGSLYLSAGNDILTHTEATISGATDVTLNLGTAATISEITGVESPTYLLFRALNGVGGTPVGIDLADATSISATATSLTLTSSLNEPGISISLSANSGNLTLNHDVTASSFTGYASNKILGSFAVTAGSITLQQGTLATVSQAGEQLSFESLAINLTGESRFLSLSGNPLKFATDLLLEGVDFSLSGTVNTQGHIITAQNVYINGVQTVTDASGNATNLSILNSDNVTIYGATLNGASGTAGSGGTLTATTSTGAITAYNINVNGSISANGGNANPAGGSAGGNGGAVNLTAQGDININSTVSATSGINGNTKWTGGNGGTVNLTAQGAVNVNSKIEVSSSDLVNNRVSAKGGNINITSHKATGTAINISNSGQLNALLNQAAAGPGGTITFVADSGGNISVAGKVRADRGTVNIRNTASAGQVALNGATLAGDVVKVGALGSNGVLTVGGGSINADTAIKLYAGGSNGSVIFNGNTSLNGASVKSIAGNTVTVNNGVNVNVTGGAATVYTSNPNYTGSGGNAATTGQFTGNGAATQPFANRPAF